MNKKWLPHIIATGAFAVFIVLGLACASTPASTSEGESALSASDTSGTSGNLQAQQQAAPINWTGDGGKGTSITILPPKGSGLAENQAYLLEAVAVDLVSNFKNFSDMTVFDRVNNQRQYDELLSGYYADDDNAGLDLGHLASTDYMLLGNITKTSTGYLLQLTVNRNSNKTTAAVYSGTASLAELENFTGIRLASMELLTKMGVALTVQARGELTRSAAANSVTAQIATARGIVAQRQGTEVAALSYYFQAAAFDPSLAEAVSRSSILNANISSGNIGDNIRNDIQWRRDWVARLTETEQYFDSFNRAQSMPYSLYYNTSDIRQIGGTDYRNETATIGGIETHLHGNGIWTVSIERALQAVYDGLNATGRKDAWGLASWPRQGVTSLNAFARRSGNFSVVFELLNSQNKVIGRQTVQTGGYWELNSSGRPVINVNADDRKTLNFQSVNANDITDRMTIRVATINGIDAETAARNGVLQITALSEGQWNFHNNCEIKNGIITKYSGKGGTIVIDNNVWGEPVTAIGDFVFYQKQLTGELIISNGVAAIGAVAFSINQLTGVTIPDSVTSIGWGAFVGNPAVINVSSGNPNYSSKDRVLYNKNGTAVDKGPGPGGGTVFYYSEAGFTMTDNRQVCHFLEAAPIDMPKLLQWSSHDTSITGTGTAIGSGRRNTALILATDAAAPAAKACKDYRGGGKTDWFLPSKDELNELYKNRAVVGITGRDYWSSSQGGLNQYGVRKAWYQVFSGGGITVFSTSGKLYRSGIQDELTISYVGLSQVRPVRAF